MGRRRGLDPEIAPAPLHLGLQDLQLAHHFDHLLEGVDPLVLETHVGRAAQDRDAQGDGAPVGVPDRPAGGLRGQHGDGVPAQQAGLGQVGGAALAAGLLIGHHTQPDPAPERRPGGLEQVGRVDHRREPRLHVGGAASFQVAVPHPGLELVRALGGHHVVVAMEIQGRPALTEECEQVGPGVLREARHFHPLVGQAEPVQFQGDPVQAFPVGAPGRVFAGDPDQVLGEGQDGLPLPVQGLLQDGRPIHGTPPGLSRMLSDSPGGDTGAV